MKNNIKKSTDKFLSLQKKHKILKKITIGLSFVVALLTIHALKAPAITLNEPITYHLNLIDGYTRTWKDEKFTTSYNLDLYFMDTNNNYIEGKDVTLQLSAGGLEDHPYGFGFVPYADATLNATRGQDLITALELKQYTTSTGDLYEFDHAEVFVNEAWQRFEETGKRWHIWCQNSSYADTYDEEGNIITPSDYGWRGDYGEANTNYSITANTKYKLVYKKVMEGQNQLADSLGSYAGITFKMFNYSGDNGNSGNNVNNNGVYDYFTFRGIPGEENIDKKINPTLDADGFINSTRIKVKPVLDQSKNPVFDCRNTEGCTDFSLGYLFGETTNPVGNPTVGVKAYAAQNTLLQKDEAGNYYYNSNNNAVDFNPNNQKFMLRNYTERSYSMTTYQNEANRYEFLPFNYWLTSSTLKTNSSNSRTYNYENSETETIDHWYGMTMEFSFSMPKEGKINDQNMVFSFSGDDDVWVFIDDVLVLDLGGTHGSVDGTIDFATGEVNSFLNWDGSTGNAANETANVTNIYQMYQNASKTDATEWNGNTYKKYTYHTLKFFYLERGSSVANCRISFNIPVLPSGSLSVQKQFNGTEKIENQDYEFTLYDVTNGNKQAVSNAKYTINEVDYYTTANGTFTLKKDETAQFILNNNHRYYVEESNPGDAAQSYSCSLNNVACPYTNQTQEFVIDYESAYQAVFTNEVKKFDITIDKIAYFSEGTENFEFQLELKDENNLPVDIKDDSNAEYLVNHTDGIVTFDLKSLENVTIKDIPIGTSVTLREMNSDGYQVIMKTLDEVLANGDTYNFIINTDKNITVHNTPGVELPETGGTGTQWYLLFGIGFITISIKFGYKYIFNTKGSKV